MEFVSPTPKNKNHGYATDRNDTRIAVIIIINNLRPVALYEKKSPRGLLIKNRFHIKDVQTLGQQYLC